MTGTTLPELRAAWYEHWHSRWSRWQGFKLPQRNMRQKARKVVRTQHQGIMPRGKALKRILWNETL